MRGHKFQCKQIEKWGKISVLRHLKANPRQPKYTLKIFAGTGVANIFQYKTFIFHANFALSGFMYDYGYNLRSGAKFQCSDI